MPVPADVRRNDRGAGQSGLQDHQALLSLGGAMSAVSAALPPWAYELLASPKTGDRLCEHQGQLIESNGVVAASIVDGVACFPISTPDHSIEFYRASGGARFHERAAVAF